MVAMHFVNVSISVLNEEQPKQILLFKDEKSLLILLTPLYNSDTLIPPLCSKTTVTGVHIVALSLFKTNTRKI